MNKIYLAEDFYCTLHLLKEGSSMTGENPFANVMRNSDKLFLQSDNSFGETPYDFPLSETMPGIYQYKINMKSIHNIPDSYTIFYKTTIDSIEYSQSEQIYFERKNKSRLV
jgi:hypothetical protein